MEKESLIEAFVEGKEARRKMDVYCPYSPGTGEYFQWNNGWEREENILRKGECFEGPV